MLGSVLGCFVGSGILHSVDSPWRWVVLLFMPVLAIPFGVFCARDGWSWWRRSIVGLSAIAFLLYMGYLISSSAPRGVDGIFGPLLFLPFGLLVLTLAHGLKLALRGSWVSRNLSWLLPALLVPSYFVLPWFGKLLYTVYLTFGFDIPVDAVPVTTYSFMYAAVKPVGIAVLFTLTFISAAGWARHFYWGNSAAGGVPAFVLPGVVLVYVVTALSYGLLNVGSSWDEAAVAVRAGHAPASFYGLRGKLMCVKPKEKDIAMYSGPVPTDRAVLTFGNTGDRIWLWGLQTTPSGGQKWASMSVRLEDVVLTPAPSGGRCEHS